MKQPFKADLQAIQRRAREKMTDGAVTGAYKADRHQVIAVLNEVLATEMVCTMRYRNHHYMAKGVYAEPIAAEFLVHANEEQGHADLVSKRITQLGGVPNWSPEGLSTRSHAPYVNGENLQQMIRENLVAERVAIETYSEIVRWLGDDDTTTRRMMEDLLSVEEEHADDLANMLDSVGSTEAATLPNRAAAGGSR